MKHSISFWKHALAVQGSITPRVILNVIIFTAFAAAVQLASEYFPQIAITIGPLEISGGIIGVILVLRLNAGYDRWWEARKLWGGIVNQSRNFAISALTYGPSDTEWQNKIKRLSSAFPFIARSSLRGEKEITELKLILNDEENLKIHQSQHMPSQSASMMASAIREPYRSGVMSGFEFMQIDKERALLIDHIGACERILKTPIPLVCAIKVRRFIFIYLLILPFALTQRVEWLTPFVQFFVAYPLLSLDKIGEELQNPFSKENLSHLPLDDISKTIQGNIMALSVDSSTHNTASNTKVLNLPKTQLTN